MPRLARLLLACLLFAWAGTAHAANPGFRTIGIWSDDDRVRLDMCVWYPVRQPPSSVRYGDWLLKVNRRAAPLEGPFPLVIISHGSAGSRFSHHDLAASLAGQGFVVVAPTHQDDNARSMRSLYTSRQLLQRLDELRHTIDKICGDPELGALVDPNRIGLLGFGSGASAALLAVGGRVSQTAWEQWKANAPADAPYMYPWARTRLDALAADPTLHHVQADNRIRCVIVAAPGYSMLFDAASLARIRVPVMLLETDNDPVNPPPRRLADLRSKLPGPVETALIRGAEPLSLMARPEGRQFDALPGHAAPTPKQQTQIFTQLNDEVSRFFLQTIGDPNLPPPPPPLPDDTIKKVEEPKPEPVKDTKPKKKKR